MKVFIPNIQKIITEITLNLLIKFKIFFEINALCYFYLPFCYIWVLDLFYLWMEYYSAWSESCFAFQHILVYCIYSIKKKCRFICANYFEKYFWTNNNSLNIIYIQNNILNVNVVLIVKISVLLLEVNLCNRKWI